MPTSFPDHITRIVQFCIKAAPRSVLDVGAGYGKYGHLIREYCDKWPWSMTIDAVEPFPEYLKRIGCSAYDDVCEDDFLTARLLQKYDLVLMIDVLEHFTRDDGERALAKALEFGHAVLVSTPRAPAEQGAEYGNEYERHRSVWTDHDLAAAGFWCPWADGISVIGLLMREQVASTLHEALERA